MKLSTILDSDNDVPNMKSSGLIVNSSGGCAVLLGQCIEEEEIQKELPYWCFLRRKLPLQKSCVQTGRIAADFVYFQDFFNTCACISIELESGCASNGIKVI